MNRELAYLEIHCWKGFGGEHYWGVVTPKDYTKDKWEVKHPMSAKEAKYLNQKDGTLLFSSKHKPGDLTERFETREELVDSTTKQFSKMYPDGVLLRGSVCVASPLEILYSPAKFKSRVNVLNKLWREFEGLYQGLYGSQNTMTDEEAGEEISKNWSSLLKSILENV